MLSKSLILGASLGLANLVAFAAPDLPAVNRPSAPPAGPLGFTGKLTPVHKKDAEGAIEIDTYTGQVATPADQRPTWADGLAMANLAERHKFYIDRIGNEAYTQDHAVPELLAYEDLEWLAVAMEDGLAEDGSERRAGDEMILAADAEFRQDVLAAILGIDRDEGDIEGAQVSVEIAADTKRTEGQMADFRQAQEEGFEQATGTDKS